MPLNTKQKKLIYQSTHRGGKELDIILGNFAQQNIHILLDQELETFEKILKLDDKNLKDIFLHKKTYQDLPYKMQLLIKKIDVS